MALIAISHITVIFRIVIELATWLKASRGKFQCINRADSFVVIGKSIAINDKTLVAGKPAVEVRPPLLSHDSQCLVDALGMAGIHRIIFNKVLTGEDQAVVFIRGFGDSAKDNRITIMNEKEGAGVRISGNRPLLREFLWSIRTVIAVEAYVAIDVQPGTEFTWKNTYDYYILPAAQ